MFDTSFWDKVVKRWIERVSTADIEAAKLTAKKSVEADLAARKTKLDNWYDIEDDEDDDDDEDE